MFVNDKLMDNKHHNIPTLNGYNNNNNTTMNIDERFDCLLESCVNSVGFSICVFSQNDLILLQTICGGDPIDLRELLEKPAPNTNEFGSFLEYILFKGAAFILYQVNVFEKISAPIISNICHRIEKTKDVVKYVSLSVKMKKQI